MKERERRSARETRFLVSFSGLGAFLVPHSLREMSTEKNITRERGEIERLLVRPFVGGLGVGRPPTLVVLGVKSYVSK